VESFLRTILNAEADDFVPSLKTTDPVFDQGSIRLEMGDATELALNLGPVLEDSRRAASVSSSPYVYALADWTVKRLFRGKEEFALSPPGGG
jgi:hypothetical protein